MKKLSILLIGLLLLTGFAFANDEFEGVPTTDIDIEATLTWGVDLNPATPTTGFSNVASFDAELWWLNEVAFASSAMDDLYGSISVTKAVLKIDGGAVAVTFDAITAKIVMSPIEIIIWAKPKVAWGNVTPITGTNIAPTLVSDELVPATIGGFTLVLNVSPAVVKVYAYSDGNGGTDSEITGTQAYAPGTNVDNDYAIGTDVTVTVDIVKIDLGGFYGWFDAAGTWGGTAKATLTLADILNGLEVWVAADFSDGAPLPWEVALQTKVSFTEANADGDKANVALLVTYSGIAPGDLDAQITFTEPKALGLVDKMSATVVLKLLELMSGAIGWNVNVKGAYDIQAGLTPSFEFDTGSDNIVSLLVQVVLGAAFTGIDLTTVTLRYVADDLTSQDPALLNDKGVFETMVKVAF